MRVEYSSGTLGTMTELRPAVPIRRMSRLAASEVRGGLDAQGVVLTPEDILKLLWRKNRKIFNSGDLRRGPPAKYCYRKGYRQNLDSR